MVKSVDFGNPSPGKGDSLTEVRKESKQLHSVPFNASRRCPESKVPAEEATQEVIAVTPVEEYPN